METTCRNCKYLDETRCRRFPPAASALLVPRQTLSELQMELQSISVWATVREGDWCGEFAPQISLSS